MWFQWLFGPSSTPGAVVVCPECGCAMSIGGGVTFGSVHDIDVDGTVSPSVVCYNCSWHVFVRLVGWPSNGGVVSLITQHV